VRRRDADAGSRQKHRRGGKANNYLQSIEKKTSVRQQARGRNLSISNHPHHGNMVFETQATEHWQLCWMVNHDWHDRRVPVSEHMEAHLEQTPSEHVGVVMQLLDLFLGKREGERWCISITTSS
jgi:hypothetical protein